MGIYLEIWRAKLKADLNRRYWEKLSRDYFSFGNYAKIFLALMTSGTVASWSIWIELESLWKTLSSIAAVLSIILPILKIESLLDKMANLKGEWTQLHNEYNFLWISRERKNEEELQENYRRLKQKEAEIEKKEIQLPYKVSNILKIQNEIKCSLGLN